MNIGIKQNNENIFTRAIIAGVLNLLNNGLSYTQYHCDGEEDDISVPWFYNMSGDERYMQDFFTHYSYCFNSNSPKPVSGNFDQIPIGILTYTGSSIAQDALTSRFVKGSFYKEINGNLESYTSYLFSIPLNMKFSCEMRLDNFTNALRLEELLRETFYKTQTIYVLYKGMRIGAQVGFSENVTLTKAVAYTFETERNKITMSFDLEVESYQPCFDKTTEYLTKNVIKRVGLNLYSENAPKGHEKIYFTSPTNQLYSNTPCLLEWDYTNENAIINLVDLSYIYDGEEIVIEQGIPNHMIYNWVVPSFGEIKNNLIFNCDVISDPNIKIKPNGQFIDSDSFIVIDKGFFPEEECVVDVIIEYINNDGEIVYTPDNTISCFIKDNGVSKFKIVDPIKLDINVPNKDNKIKLKIYSSLNKEIYGETDYIEII